MSILRMFMACRAFFKSRGFVSCHGMSCKKYIIVGFHVIKSRF